MLVWLVGHQTYENRTRCRVATRIHWTGTMRLIGPESLSENPGWPRCKGVLLHLSVQLMAISARRLKSSVVSRYTLSDRCKLVVCQITFIKVCITWAHLNAWPVELESTILSEYLNFSIFTVCNDRSHHLVLRQRMSRWKIFQINDAWIPDRVHVRMFHLGGENNPDNRTKVTRFEVHIDGDQEQVVYFRKSGLQVEIKCLIQAQSSLITWSR